MTNGQPLIIDGNPKEHHAAYAITFSNHDVYSLRTRSYEGDAWVVAKEADLGEIPPAVLVELYNRAAKADGAKVVTKFSSREVMHRRVWPVIEYLARPVPAAEATASQETTAATNSDTETDPMNAMERNKRARKRNTVVKKSNGAKRAAKKSNADARPGRPSGMVGKTIHVVKDNTASREGSARFEAWKLIKNGMKFDDYVKKGGSVSDLRAFIKYGFVSVR